MSRRARALIVVVAFAVAIPVFLLRVSHSMRDFEVYWEAGGHAAGAARLYRPEDEHYQFKYFPAFAILTIPLALTPLPVAKAIWFFLSVALLLALWFISLRLLPEPRARAGVLVACAIVVMGKFYGHELVLGQVNLLLAVLVAGAVLAMRTSREPLAGVLVAAAIVVKPYALLLAPWIAARRRTGSIVAMSVGIAIAFLLPAIRYGVAGDIALHLEWWRTVTQTTAPNLLLIPDNVSLTAMAMRWLGVGSGATMVAAAIGAVLLVLVATAFRWRRGRVFPEALEAAMLLIAIPLLSPQGWDYVFLIATPAVMLLVNYADALPRVLRWVTVAALAVIGLTIYDVVGRRAYGAMMNASVITWCFVVAIAALSVLRFRRAA